MSVNFIVPFEGKRVLLDKALNTLGGGSAKVGLFQSNTTPTTSTVYSDLTIATFSGYADQNFSVPTADASPDGSDRAWALGSEYTFTHNGGGTSNTIYGIVIWITMSNRILWIARLATSKTMSASGHEIKVTPTLTMQSEF